VTRPRVVDAHVHFWDPTRLDYPWLAETPALRVRVAATKSRVPSTYSTDLAAVELIGVRD